MRLIDQNVARPVGRRKGFVRLDLMVAEIEVRTAPVRPAVLQFTLGTAVGELVEILGVLSVRTVVRHPAVAVVRRSFVHADKVDVVRRNDHLGKSGIPFTECQIRVAVGVVVRLRGLGVAVGLGVVEVFHGGVVNRKSVLCKIKVNCCLRHLKRGAGYVLEMSQTVHLDVLDVFYIEEH